MVMGCIDRPGASVLKGKKACITRQDFTLEQENPFWKWSAAVESQSRDRVSLVWVTAACAVSE